jgi:uncharacterized protein YecT (DUF1311 family)
MADLCAGDAAVETEAAPDVKAFVDKKQRAWSHFREVNGQQQTLAARGQADPLLDHELERLNVELDASVERKTVLRHPMVPRWRSRPRPSA